jgi:hypothetical protein
LGALVRAATIASIASACRTTVGGPPNMREVSQKRTFPGVTVKVCNLSQDELIGTRNAEEY